MKKLLKMFWMMVLAMMMVLGSVGAYAADTQAGTARAFICGNCGAAMNGEYIEYGSWTYPGGTRPCQHGHTGAKDQKKVRKNKVYAKCGSCGYRMFKTYRTQEGWDCMG